MSRWVKAAEHRVMYAYVAPDGSRYVFPKSEWDAEGRGYMHRRPPRALETLYTTCTTCGYVDPWAWGGLCPECLIDHANDHRSEWTREGQ